MYKGKKISVAMATYNGEKYIREQLESFCSQTVLPDEIVISDDASSDSTIKIIRQFAEEPQAKKIEFRIIENSSNGGIVTNFNRALRETSGDIIILAAQDDIQLDKKIEIIAEEFASDSSVMCVVHDYFLIDKNGKRLGGDCDSAKYRYGISKEKREKMSREVFLEHSVIGALISGMAMSLSSELVQKATPIPANTWYEDQWLFFCAICEDAVVNIPQKLVFKRIHENNASKKETNKTGIRRMRLVLERELKEEKIIEALGYYFLGNAMCCYLEKHGLDSGVAYSSAGCMKEIGFKIMDASRRGRIRGAIGISKLYLNNQRYRKSGRNSFVFQLIRILFFCKKKRLQIIDTARQETQFCA